MISKATPDMEALLTNIRSNNYILMSSSCVLVGIGLIINIKFMNAHLACFT